MEENIKWKKLGPLPGILYAEMVAEVLKQRGIPYYLSQDGFCAAYSIKGTSAVGNQAYIFVPEEFVSEARDILEGMLDHI